MKLNKNFHNPKIRAKPSALALTIGWLYPELMSTYGDRGNIMVISKRSLWRGIKPNIKRLDLGFKTQDLEKCDLLFMGGAQDKQQEIVSGDLAKKIKTIKNQIEKGVPGLYICGAYQFLGKYYKEQNGRIIPGLNIIDIYTKHPGRMESRLVGNVIIDIADLSLELNTLVGFENHGGRTYLGEKVKPLGKIIKGYGNNGKDKTEGAIYKNSYCSYLHGPILPKNPHIADLLIKLALDRKYNIDIKLESLDDYLEKEAHFSIAKRAGLKI